MKPVDELLSGWDTYIQKYTQTAVSTTMAGWKMEHK